MLPLVISQLQEKFMLFSGIGSRSAQKLAIEVLEMPSPTYKDFVTSMQLVKQSVCFCDNCGFFAERTSDINFCEICKNKDRNQLQICLIEKPTDVMTIEKSQIYKGTYHILGKLISPLDNIFIEHTNLPKLLATKLPNLLSQNPNINIEIIVFLKNNFAGDTTFAYLRESIEEYNGRIKLTQLAQGLPSFYNPDTLDQATMAKALENRR
jgi:recombination protein RecR